MVANLANAKWFKRLEKLLKPWHMGTHFRVLSESFPMNTNMTGFRWFSKIFVSLCFGPKYSALALEELKLRRHNINDNASSFPKAVLVKVDP